MNLGVQLEAVASGYRANTGDDSCATILRSPRESTSIGAEE